MAEIKLNGNPVNTIGTLPEKNSLVKDFKLVAGDLSELSLNNFTGKKKILNIVPSLDTGVCAASARRFNEDASNLENVEVLVISKDLPFAQKRFCETEGLKNVIALSAFRSEFGKDYQVEITDGPLAGLLSRAIVVLDENNKVMYTEQVAEITQEPNYEAALNAVK